ncbi:hypothetical protein HanIR_Chr14g0695941 [Helianthus annuus]|nr:hypothetical protein HanIR_Chr14g0695941 [Helianthus annuus]
MFGFAQVGYLLCLSQEIELFLIVFSKLANFKVISNIFEDGVQNCVFFHGYLRKIQLYWLNLNY